MRTKLPLLGLAVWLLLASPLSAEEVVQPLTVSPTHPLVFSGKTYNSKAMPVVTPFPGTVVKQLCDVGSRVKKDDALAEIKLETQQLIEIKQRLAIDLPVKKAELEIAKTELELKNLNNRREMLEQLVNDGMAPARNLQATNDQIAITEKTLAANRNSLAQIRRDHAEQVKLLSEQFGRPVKAGSVPQTLLLRSPIDGIVLQVSPAVEEGMRVQGQMFLVGEMNPMLIRAQAFESDVARLKIGSQADVVVESLNNKQMKAILENISLTPISPQLEAPSYYLLELSIDNSDNSLREGYKVRITFP